MKNSVQKQSGFVLVLAVMIMALGAILVSSLVTSVAAYRRFNSVVLKREQAHLIAMSGLAIAMNQLMVSDAKSEKSEDKQTDLQRMLLVINRWQSFDLTQEHGGIEAKCELYITCEKGKIDLNQWYDFKDKKIFVKEGLDGHKLFRLLSDKLGIANFEEIFVNICRKREKPFEDVSEFLIDPACKKLQEQLFVAPGNVLYATDLFTVVSGTREIDPLQMTVATSTLFGLACQTAEVIQAYKDIAQKYKNITGQVTWAQQWEQGLAAFYNKGYSNIPEELKLLLTKKIEAPIFSVVCYGHVGGVVQKLCALLVKEEAGTEKPPQFSVKKVYWL